MKDIQTGKLKDIPLFLKALDKVQSTMHEYDNETILFTATIWKDIDNYDDVSIIRGFNDFVNSRTIIKKPYLKRLYDIINKCFLFRREITDECKTNFYSSDCGTFSIIWNDVYNFYNCNNPTVEEHKLFSFFNDEKAPLNISKAIIKDTKNISPKEISKLLTYLTMYGYYENEFKKINGLSDVMIKFL